MAEAVKKKEIVISENRDFKGVWIPEKLYLTREFTPNEKFLLIEIHSLTKKKNRECFANNKHFADFVGLKENTVQKMMLKFENAGYIKRNYEYREGTKEIDRRTIKLTQKFYDDFINETENTDFSAEGMENNPEAGGIESTDPIENNPQGNGLKVGEKYNNFKSKDNLSDIDLSDTYNSFSNEKDNSNPDGLDLYKSHSRENEARTTKTLGKKTREKKIVPLKDMPTRAYEIAYDLFGEKVIADKAKDCVGYFLDKYKAFEGKEHIPLTNYKLSEIVETMASTITIRHEKNGEDFETDYKPLISDDVSESDYKAVIDEYFLGKIKKCDYSLVYFTQDGVLTNLMHKCMREDGTMWYESYSF